MLQLATACPKLSILQFLHCRGLTSVGVVALLTRRPRWEMLAFNCCEGVVEDEVFDLMEVTELEYDPPHIKDVRIEEQGDGGGGNNDGDNDNDSDSDASHSDDEENAEGEGGNGLQAEAT